MESNAGEIQKLRSRIQELESENRALRHRLEEVETQNDDLLAEISLLEEKIEQLEEPDLSFTQPQEEEISYGSDEERVYLASKTRLIFHRPNCKWATYIPNSKLVEFSSHREAVEAGFKPCKTCRA